MECQWRTKHNEYCGRTFQRIENRDGEVLCILEGIQRTSNAFEEKSMVNVPLALDSDGRRLAKVLWVVLNEVAY